MSERRRFSDRERAALYLSADGNCEGCGVELAPGWHGDHMHPHSKGGPTDVINGQALCPACNLKKGDRMLPALRDWQHAALRAYRATAERPDFLLEATPGAGKTIFALTAARELLDAGEVQRVIVVCPTAHLKRQWADAANRFRIALDPRFVNANAVLAPDYDGAAVTYAQLTSGALIVRRLCAKPTLVILDEVHHCGEEDHSSWGRAIGEAFGVAHRRLLLSGTPFREDGRPIPFVVYDGNGQAAADYTYGYADALRDEVCRPIEFLAYDGEMHWREVTGARLSTLLSETVTERDARSAFQSALLADGQWMPDVLAAADAELTRVREQMPDAGGLVLASTRGYAYVYAKLLEQITGQPATVVVSRDNGEDEGPGQDPSKEIARFTADPSKRWLVAVKMVSEGVDVPRLAVGVYATNTWTEMFFRQAVGRFVRRRSEVECGASLFVPSVQQILAMAARIADQVDVTLRAEAEREPAERTNGEQITLELRQPLASGEAQQHSAIVGGQTFTPEDLLEAQAIKLGEPSLANLSDRQIALILLRAGVGRLVGRVEVPAPVPAPVPVDRQIKALRDQINRKVNRYVRNTDVPYSHVHGELNTMFGDKLTTASIETLSKRLEVLDKWLG